MKSGNETTEGKPPPLTLNTVGAYLLVVAIPLLIFVALKFRTDHLSGVQVVKLCSATAVERCEAAWNMPWYLWADSRGFRILRILAVLSAAAMLGAIGSFFNVMLGNLHLPRRSVISNLLFGSLSAIMITLLFAGGLVAGSLFPQMKDEWQDVIHKSSDFAKLLVWSFIAGFSQRLMPGILKNLELKVEVKDSGGNPVIARASTDEKKDAG